MARSGSCIFDEDMHLFTDGSTICPEHPCLSLSAWGVVLAEPQKLDGARVVNGNVVGEQQTNNRAELLAGLAAVLSSTGCCGASMQILMCGVRLMLRCRGLRGRGASSRKRVTERVADRTHGYLRQGRHAGFRFWGT